MVYGIQNDRTDQTETMQKEIIQNMLTELLKKTTDFGGLDGLDKFLWFLLSFSATSTYFFSFFFLYCLSLISAVILNTINHT